MRCATCGVARDGPRRVHGRNRFTGGEIIQVVYDIGDDPYVDLELKFAARLARD